MQAPAAAKCSPNTAARELQRCRPDLDDRVLAGEMSTREALRIAKPEKYGKRDKVEQWLASYRAWSAATRLRAITALSEWEDARNG